MANNGYISDIWIDFVMEIIFLKKSIDDTFNYGII